jgi:hypothetical protein
MKDFPENANPMSRKALTPPPQSYLEWQRAFTQVYDETAIRSYLAQNKVTDLIARGFHFAVYACPGERRKIPLVIKVADPKTLGDHGLSRWDTALKRLRAEQLPLFPPFAHFFDTSGRPILVMPRGETFRAPAELATQATALLKERGLVMRDVMQWSKWQELPFIHDLSDLDLK